MIGATERAEPIRITLAEADRLVRLSTGLASFDKVLGSNATGSGLAVGSVILLGGDPGVGKSTLLASVLARASTLAGRRVLYTTGEETVSQVADRARRIDAAHDDIWIVNETDVAWILQRAREINPAILVVDSIQTLSGEDIGPARSLAAITKGSAQLAGYAKSTGTIVILICHVTKEGDLAGPETLQHIVDVTLQLELGEHFEGRFRYLRASKNRFGPTTEVAAFEMTAGGMISADLEAARADDHHQVAQAEIDEIARLRSALAYLEKNVEGHSGVLEIAQKIAAGEVVA
jgi:DNA repair protein RadA/Sms